MMKEFIMDKTKFFFLKSLLLIIAFFSVTIVSAKSDEPEKARPQIGLEVERKVSMIDIEGEKYNNVKVTLESNEPDYLFVSSHKVKIKVENSEGKKIYKKTFRDAFLYVFRNGQIQVGRVGFDQMLITKSLYDDTWIAMIREKEGVY